MIKQPIQPLKFFASYLEVEKDFSKKDPGNPGTHIITEDILFVPPFQIKFNNRASVIIDFTFELINYTDGTINDITTDVRAAGVFTYDDYQNLIIYRCPMKYLVTEGNYYLKITEGTECSSDLNEIWYSEVFKLCDLNRNLLRDVTVSGFNSDTTDVLATRDMIQVKICEAAGDGGYFDMGHFYVIENEPLDFFCYGAESIINCGVTTFLPLHFAIVDLDGNVISNQVEGIEGQKKGRFTPTRTRPARLRAWISTTETPHTGRSQWQNHLFYANPQLYSGLYSDHCDSEHENIGKRKVLRWSHSCNVCDMIYEEQSGYVVDGETSYYWTMAYENYLILDDPPLVPDFAIIETVSENDKGDKSLLLGAHQEWYFLQIGTSENLAKAIQNIHLLSTVEIDYNGERHTICENTSDITYSDDYNFLTRFRFREESCALACCFDVDCCPNLENVIDVLGNDADLPSCDDGTDGDRYLVNKGALGTYYIYVCDGSNWSYYPSLNVAGNCIIDEDAIADGDQTPHMYYNEEYANWYRFAYISSVTNNTDGTATINLRNYSKHGIVVIVQVDGADVGNAITLEGTAGETITVTTGAGTFDFNLRFVACEYGVTNTVEETITDV